MSLASLIKELNEMISKEDLLRLMDLTDAEWGKDTLGMNFLPSSKEAFLMLCNKYEIDPDYIFAIRTSLGSYCYYKFPVFVTINVLNEQFMEQLKIKERIVALTKEHEKALREKRYYAIFAFTEENAKVLLFNEIYWMANDDEKYEMFKEIYTSIDYGHRKIDPEIFKDVWRHQPQNVRSSILRAARRQADEDVLTIYRGEGEESTSYKRANSWTTSIVVACFFASRIRSDTTAKVYRAKVKVANVLDMYGGRKEEEVLVLPESLFDIEEVPYILFMDEFNQIKDEGYLNEYQLYRNTFIKDEHYRHPNGVHGKGHVTRVLFHAITMSRALGLSEADRATLANASIYHDIGRKHDGYCTMHGEWSWNQYVQTIHQVKPMVAVNGLHQESGKYILSRISSDDMQIIRFLIEYHCRDDEEGYKALRKMHLPSKARERAWRLYQIFKDCDGLDRVRLPLDEVDPKYFRTEEAKQRLLYAFQVKNYNTKGWL